MSDMIKRENKKEETTDEQQEYQKKATESEQNKKQESRMMNFFNQEFIDRKIDFKPRYNIIFLFIRKIVNDSRNLPEDLKSVVQNSKIYDRLLQLEKSIDEKMYKTRLDIQENLMKPTPKVKALLRTHLYSYFIKENKEESNMEGDENEYTWVLRIQGKIMPVLQSQPGGFYRKFSYFFNKVQFKFDSENIEEFKEIEWLRANNSDVDGFEIKRSCKNFDKIKIKILFYVNSYIQEFKVSDELSEIIGIKQETRPRILYHLWQYIKINSLQDIENPNLIINNKELQHLFGCDRMDITSLTSRLVHHIKQPDPIEIEFTIQPVMDWKDSQKLYDIIVNIDDPHFLDISTFLSNIDNESVLFPKSLFFMKNDNIQKNDKAQQTNTEKFYNKIQEYDRNANDLIEKLKKHKYKYDFYESFSNDPIKFINNFLIQQNSLLKIMKEESSIIDGRWDYNSAQYYKDYEVIIIKFLIF